MQIKGYEIALSEAALDDIFASRLQIINMIDENFSGFKNLAEGDRKALHYLVRAAKMINDVALEQDHPLNLLLKTGLEEAASAGSTHAAKALRLFNSLNGVTGLNGLDPEPVEIFKNVHGFKGRNFYPSDLGEEELHRILLCMLQAGRIEEVRRIVSARTMVRRKGKYLTSIDYTEYFAPIFSQVANELELAAHYSTDAAFKDYLGWQVQALLQNNEDMDMLADRHWTVLQDSPLEFTLSRENYDDEMTPTVFANPELSGRLKEAGIEVVPKDMLGARVGIVNAEGTKLLLRFKNQMKDLAGLMPLAERYTQNINAAADLKQTMVDVDLATLQGDYAQCRGGITTAQNLPNNDKLSVKCGGGRRNVYHRQVRMAVDPERTRKMLEALVAPEFHRWYNPEAEHLFVIGHENGHSLGPGSEFQTALGAYAHIIEENKADVISITFMPEYVKTGIISEATLKEIYVTWIVRLLLKSRPQLIQPHRVGDLIHFNFLRQNGVILFNADRKLEIDFTKIDDAIHRLLHETIEVQLSKSPQKAKEFIDRYTTWDNLTEYIAETLQQLGVKPYKEIRTYL